MSVFLGCVAVALGICNTVGLIFLSLTIGQQHQTNAHVARTTKALVDAQNNTNGSIDDLRVMIRGTR